MTFLSFHSLKEKMEVQVEQYFPIFDGMESYAETYSLLLGLETQN